MKRGTRKNLVRQQKRLKTVRRHFACHKGRLSDPALKRRRPSFCERQVRMNRQAKTNNL